MCSYIEKTRLQTSKITNFHRQWRKVFFSQSPYFCNIAYSIWWGTLLYTTDKIAYKPNYTTLPKYEASRGVRMAQWWECSPPTKVSQDQFPNPASYEGWVCCWFSTLLQEVFSGYSSFPLSSKTNISKFQDSILECTGISDCVLMNSLVLRR